MAIRPDLLPPAYLAELQKLLDQVAPFESQEAKALVEETLGCPIGSTLALTPGSKCRVDQCVNLYDN